MKFSHQVIFWFIVSVILILVFGSVSKDFTETFFFVTCLLPVIVGTSYFFNFYLVPNYLLTRRYVRFSLYFLYTLIISIYLAMLIITLAFVYLAHYKFSNMNPVSTNVSVLIIVLYLVVFAKAFVLLVGKYYGHSREIESLSSEKAKKEKGYLIVKANRQSRKILYENLSYVESLGDYIRLNLSNEDPVLSKEKISAVAKSLPSSFIRIHRSFVVNSDKISSFTAEEVVIDDHELPISRSYKKEVLEKLSSSSDELKPN